MMTTQTGNRFRLLPLVGTQHRPSSKRFRIQRRAIAKSGARDDGTPELVAKRQRLAYPADPVATSSPLELLAAKSKRSDGGEAADPHWPWPITPEQARAGGAYAVARSIYLGRATRTALAYEHTTATPTEADPRIELTDKEREDRYAEARDHYRAATAALAFAGRNVLAAVHDAVILEIWPAPMLAGGICIGDECRRMDDLVAGLAVLARLARRRQPVS